jgi:type I restriction enzyme, S subunit
VNRFPRIPLGECCEIVSGATPDTGTAGYWEGDICWATPKDLSGLDGHYISNTPRKLTKLGLESCSASILPAYSVLFSSRAPIGHVAINTEPMATNQGFKSFVPNSDIDAKFLFHWLRANRSYLEGLGVGATFKEVSKAVISKVKVPVPPMPEQRRIAAILDKVDALRTKRREALAQLDRLAQSIFVEMFGDPSTNPQKWNTRVLGDVCQVGSSKRVFVEELVEEGIPFYRGTEIGQLGDSKPVQPSLFISPAHYKRLRAEAGVPSKGDLLLPSICPDGRIYTVNTDDPFYFKDARVLWIKVDQSHINSTYLKHYLKLLFSKNYSKIASGTTFAELKIFALKSLDIQLPPMHLQLQFANSVLAVDSQIVTAKKSEEKLAGLFQSLQSLAFSGAL